MKTDLQIWLDYLTCGLHRQTTATTTSLPYEKYLYQSIGAIYVPYMSPIISIGEL